MRPPSPEDWRVAGLGKPTAFLTWNPALSRGTAGLRTNPNNRLVKERGRRPAMKIRNSLKSLKARHRDCRVIRRRGRTYVINKTNRRFKARQG